MSDIAHNRAGEHAHVIAAKNLADRLVSVPRSETLETIARANGFRSWNAYRAAGEARIRVPMRDGSVRFLTPGVYRIHPDIFPQASAAILNCARRSGYGCDHSAPAIVSNSVAPFPALSRLFGGMVLGNGLRHRGYFVSRDVPNDMLLESFLSRPPLDGVVILDMRDIPKETLEALARAWPQAIIITCGHPDVSACDLAPGKREPDPVDLHEQSGLWADRLLLLLEAFVSDGIEFDSRAVPRLDDISPKTPAIRNFLESVPDYSIEAALSGKPQSGKSREQYGFLTVGLP